MSVWVLAHRQNLNRSVICKARMAFAENGSPKVELLIVLFQLVKTV